VVLQEIVELLVTMLDINATRAARMLTTMDEESTSTQGYLYPGKDAMGYATFPSLQRYLG
jgi:hypothetical protein